MNVTDFARALRRGWLIVLLAVLIGGGAGVAAAQLTTQQYSAQATLYVAATPSSDASDPAYEREQVALQRVQSYLPLVDDPRVLDEAVRRVTPPMTPRELGSRVSVSSPLDSVLIDVAATDTSPELAASEANAVGSVFAEQSARLTPGGAPGEASDVTVFLVQPAVAPDGPSSISSIVTIAIGLLAGLVVGLALALGRDRLDRRVRSVKDLDEALTTPVVGTVLDEPDDRGDTLIVVAEPRSDHAEQYRRLRSSLPVLRGEAPGGVVLVSSPSSAEGRTTVALNLAATAAAAGSRVLVIDADLRRPAVARRFGLEDRRGLTDLLTDEPDAESTDAIWHVGPGTFDVLTSGEPPSAPAETLESAGMRKLISSLRYRYDLVLVDCSPVLPVTDAAALAPAADGALLICRQDRTTSDHLVEAARILDTVSTPLLGTVLTGASQSRRSRRDRESYLADTVTDTRAARKAAETVVEERPAPVAATADAPDGDALAERIPAQTPAEPPTRRSV